jgi:DNA-entry nuclease
MKLRNSLLVVLALILTFCTLFTGCQEVVDDSAIVDSSSEGEVLEDVEEYGYSFWDYFFGWATPKTTQKATEKATQKTTQKATEKVTQKATEKVTQKATTQKATSFNKTGASLASVMTYTGKAYATVYNNKPDFAASEITSKAYEFYSPLDSKGRCGYAMACVGKELMPTTSRGSISSIKPTGWVQNTYDTKIVNGGSLYNRAHLIGWQLTGENANKKNLITGTRYMNENMIPFENMIADYVKETGNHVMYRVTPIFEGNNLVASGVHMEAYSVEDSGKGVCFNVYLYNVQPGVTIEYSTGKNYLTSSNSNTSSGSTNSGSTNSSTSNSGSSNSSDTSSTTYILNTGSKKIHSSTCKSVSSISTKNKKTYTGSTADLLKQGYTACGTCRPLG